MAKKGGLSSPMEHGIKEKTGTSGTPGSTMDHNPTPQFSKPHDVGKDGIRLVFETGVKGKSYRGPISKDAASIVSSPMNEEKKK